MRRKQVVRSPEHVLIELVPAGLGTRLGAFLLDFSLFLGGAGLVQLAARALPQGARPIFSGTLVFALFWAYHPLFEVLWNGQSPGKRILKLRVVDGRGLPVDLSQSVVRNVVRVVDFMPAGGLGMLSALFDPLRRRLGDRAADTLVVSEWHAPAPKLEALGARRFNSLSTPRVRRAVEHQLGVEERELLFSLCLRAAKLSEAARYQLFEEVGQHYRKRFSIEDPALSGESVVRGLAALCARGNHSTIPFAG